ncbi:MAG: hypothetical protein P4K94_08505 [Terracidiphilus sp.]|nr:hypothetical protein [Terracidiphilus sp.]
MSFHSPHLSSCHYAVLLAAFTVSPLFAQDSPAPKESSSVQSATTDLSVGKVRETIAATQALIQAHPEDPANYVKLAYTLSDAGMGDTARDEALKVTQIAPQSSLAYSALGWVLHHNSIGVDYGKGYDYTGSIAAYRKAIELDPSDLEVRYTLANDLEFNEDGIQYAPNSHLADAIEIYRYIKARQNPVEPDVEDNILIDLFYSGQFKQVITEIDAVSSSPIREGIAIAAIAADQGSAIAIAHANQITGDTKRRNAALNFAAAGLTNMRLYTQAADLLEAGIEVQGDSGVTLHKIQVLRSIKPYQGESLPDSDPRSPIQKHLTTTLTGNLTDAVLSACVSRHAYSDPNEWASISRRSNEEVGTLHQLSIKTGLPLIVMRDIVLGTMKLIVEPSDQPGYRIDLQIMSVSKRFFVVKEDGGFRIVAEGNASAPVGAEALYLLQHGQEAVARSLLDWKRDQYQVGTGNSPIEDAPFARLWTSGRSKGLDAIKTAAASLLMDSADGAALLPYLISKRNQSPEGPARANLDAVLAHIYLHLGDGPNSTLITRKLLRQYPDSAAVVRLAGGADSLVHDWPSWKSMLQSRLAKKPNDRELLVQMAVEAEAEGDFVRARESLRTLLDSGHALVVDYNAYAWLSLFDGTTDSRSVEAAERANLLSEGTSFAELHTLACIYATQGRTAEARQLLLQAMSSGNLVEPNDPIWLGFGLIYEQYGVRDAAIGAYKRILKPERNVSPIEAFALAQTRLKALDAR